jgi:phage terminase large subunit
MQTQPIFQPRQYQLRILSAIDKGYKRAFCLWHRRAGKDLTLWNLVAKKAIEDIGLYYYLLPTYTQAKKIIWDGITNDGNKFIDYIPQQIIENQNGQEMKISLKNGSMIQLIGTDNYDAIRGTNPRGCVFSEFAYQNPMAWEVVKPILRVNKGWAVFNTTPNGKNHSYELDLVAQDSPYWFREKLTVDDTNVVTRGDIEMERAEGMTEEMIQQEYYCSYDIGTLGAYYSNLVNMAREQGRITNVTYEPNIPVNVWLDLGRNDTTAIIFEQTIGNEIRLIDFLEHNGEGVAYYCKELDKKPYRYGTMYLPHDATHKRMESEKSLQQQFDEGGFRTEIVDKADINHGIQQVRKIFPRLWFDQEKCKWLIRALENYHKDWDNEKKVFKEHPLHDWSSNAADALRYLGIGHEDSLLTTQIIEDTIFDPYDPL